MRPVAPRCFDCNALGDVVGGRDDSSEVVLDATSAQDTVDAPPPSEGTLVSSTTGAPSTDTTTDAYPGRPSGSSPDSFFSVGVGTLRNLVGNGNGSPVDSQAVVQTMDTLGALGNGDALRFNRSKFADVVSSDATAAFTGQGATGLSSLADSIPFADVAGLVQYHRASREVASLEELNYTLRDEILNPPPGLSPLMQQRRESLLESSLARAEGALGAERDRVLAAEPTFLAYSNPLPGDPAQTFDEQTRERQARLLLEQPIATLHRDAYGDRLPTRAEVIAAAAQRYGLDPAVVGGIILHEQRDQSRREDAADILGASLAGRNTSIGLGQVLMSTAASNNAELLSDTVDEASRRALTRDGVARLLTSDDHNILATARYLRHFVADAGANAGTAPGSLPNTRAAFPGLDTDAYRTSTWSANPANIRAAGAEYTSLPWDDHVLAGYGNYVLTAVEDIRRAGVFDRR